MSAPLLFVTFVVAVVLCGCTSAPNEQPRASSDAPAIVIRQYPEYPIPGRDSEFPGGLIAALWRDGHMIRPATSDSVGQSYVEGTVTARRREEFFRFLSTAVDRAPKSEGIPLNVATQSITISGVTTSNWRRILPDTTSVWREVESRLLDLRIQDSRAVDWAVVRASSWYK